MSVPSCVDHLSCLSHLPAFLELDIFPSSFFLLSCPRIYYPLLSLPHADTLSPVFPPAVYSLYLRAFGLYSSPFFSLLSVDEVLAVLGPTPPVCALTTPSVGGFCSAYKNFYPSLFFFSSHRITSFLLPFLSPFSCKMSSFCSLMIGFLALSFLQDPLQ